MKYLGIDIGGTWIKATMVDETYFSLLEEEKKTDIHIKKVKSPLHKCAAVKELIEGLRKLILKFGAIHEHIGGVGISTAGIVDYNGSKVVKAAPHLSVLKTDKWKTEIEKELGCVVTLINDADATTIGISELGLLKGNQTVGIMPIGTGLGFSIWRNGRRWRPGKVLSILGSVRTSSGVYDNIASASILAAKNPENDLIKVLTQESCQKAIDAYMDNLVMIITTAFTLYNLDKLMICGGLADAVAACSYPLEDKLNSKLTISQSVLGKVMSANVLKEGNKLQLIGAVSLARGESIARSNQVAKQYRSIQTEIPYQHNIQLQHSTTQEIVRLLWKAEQEAGELLKNSLPAMEKVIEEISERILKGGRLIYVGAGTSGRIAAMDAVEIPCTYGFPEDRILSLVSGGIADAAIEIESNYEEDASAVPEMLLMNITENDSVVGISASGSAYYVQSALAFAKERGAYSVMIQSELPKNKLPFCDEVVPLNSGYEVVAGSTRMKAGTATKKVLNFLSSTIMIKLGKVSGPYMVDVACINAKLVGRAKKILCDLYNIEDGEAAQRLHDADMDLGKVIRILNERGL
nr:N-acetylmuramic acid 6-phosphate etherase [Allomuricauda sp.]